MSAPVENEDSPDELTREYQRASASDRSRPGSATRAAIMAEARRSAALAAATRAATQRTAANDSWWNWKAAASVAVVALAGVLSWRSFRTEPLVQRPVAESVLQSTAPDMQVAPADAAAPADATTPAQAEAPALAKSVTADRSPPPQPSAPPSASLPAPAPAAEAAAPARAATERKEVQRSANNDASESANFARAAPQAASRGVTAEADSSAVAGNALPQERMLALMERYFPESFGDSPPGPRPWFLFDPQGQVARTGRRVWQGLDELQAYLQAYLQPGLPGIRIARATVGTVRNARGQSVDYALLWMAAESPEQDTAR